MANVKANVRSPKGTRKLLSRSVGAVLEFTAGEDKGREVPLVHMRTVIGRKFGDLLVRDIKVSGSHTAIEWKQGGFWVLDLGSSNGTYLNGKKIKESPLQPGDEVKIGLTAFHLKLDVELATRLVAKRPIETSRHEGGLSDLLENEFVKQQSTTAEDQTQSMMEDTTEQLLLFSVHLGPLRGKKFSLKEENILIGRSDVEISLKDPDVSRKHALVEKQKNGQVVLRDLASRNGTFVNDRRISNCVLSKGDFIRVGQTTLIFNGAIAA